METTKTGIETAGTNRYKDWVKENVPMLTSLYENKYVGMLYDRFAGLPVSKQKQWILGGVSFFTLIFFGYLFVSYLSLWTTYGKIDRNATTIHTLLQHQKQMRERSNQIQQLERNVFFQTPGTMRQYLLDQAKNAGISGKMVEVAEKEGGGEGGENSSSVQAKTASVTLNRLNLQQVKSFLQNLEFGPYTLLVNSLQITNDDKIRGYMKLEVAVSAYLFGKREESLGK